MNKFSEDKSAELPTRVTGKKAKVRANSGKDRINAVFFVFQSEVAKKSVSARPNPIPEGTLGTRVGPGRAGMAPTSGPGWVRNAVKQSTWRMWTGPLRTRDETWTGPDRNRRLGLSDSGFRVVGL